MSGISEGKARRKETRKHRFNSKLVSKTRILTLNIFFSKLKEAAVAQC